MRSGSLWRDTAGVATQFWAGNDADASAERRTTEPDLTHTTRRSPGGWRGNEGASVQDAQYRALQGWIREVQPMLLLGDWEIWLQRDSCAGEAWAYVEVAEMRDTAWIKVAGHAFFDDCTPEEQRLYLAHEMVHIITAPVLQVHETLMGRDGERESVKVYATEHRRVVEQATHKLARLLAPALPLPDLPRTEDQEAPHTLERERDVDMRTGLWHLTGKGAS